MAWIISEIEWLILAVAAGILGLANYLLGWSTYVTVFQFGNLVGNSAGLLAAWGVMRDVANIVLLFGFIFLGVSTILNLPHSEYTAKKAIPALIIFALLLNFSLFAVEAVIDVSNALATSIYEQATGGQGVCEQDTGTIDCIFKQGIGGQVMAMSGMASMYGFGSGENEAEKGANVKLVVVYAGLIIFAVITTLVLFAAAIMLIIRAVVLAFLMVTAPIGFAGMAIPPLHEMASRWWKELISQALFAPVYFLLALLSLKIMSGVMIALGTQSTGATRETLAGVFMSAGDNGARGSNITIVMTFALIIGFMVAALMFAKKSSAMGTSMAMSGAGKLAFGSLGFVGRNTVGRASYRAAERLKATSFGQTSRLGITAVKAFDRGSKASFDARGAGMGIGKGITTAAGNVGTAQKGGYAGIVHTAEDERKKYADGLKNSTEDKKKIADYETRIENVNKQKDADIEAADAAHDAKIAELNAQIEAKQAESSGVLESHRERIKNKQIELETKQQALVAATGSGDQARIDAATADVTTAQEELRAFETALKDEQSRVAEGTKGIRDEITKQNKAHGEAVGKINDAAKEQTKAFSSVISDIRKQPKLRYAETLHNRSLFQNTIGLIGGGVSATADHHASEAIRREVNKDDVQRMVDALNKASAPAAAHPAPANTHSDGGHDAHDDHENH